MDQDVRELLHDMNESIKGMKKDIDELMQWKAKLTGIFVAVSVCCTFLIGEIKSHLGIH